MLILKRRSDTQQFDGAVVLTVIVRFDDSIFIEVAESKRQNHSTGFSDGWESSCVIAGRVAALPEAFARRHASVHSSRCA